MSSLAQFSARQIINENAGTVRVVRSADFDNDNDVDVVVSAFDLIAWYENIDGLANFSTPIPIQEGKGQSFSLFPADIDDDDKVDLIVSFFDEDEIGWYRNLGNGVFSSMQLITNNLQNASGVYASDIDGDTDLDVVLGVTNGNGLYWVENLDGLGTFGPRITIDSNISQARTQIVKDIDGDDDNDILTNSVGSSFLSWFENVDGLGTFSIQHIIDVDGLYENSIDLVDLDGDLDLDILSIKFDLVIWRENLDGQGTFGSYQIISDQVINPFDVTSADIDKDSDLDVISASANDNKIAWYENEDGVGSFGMQNIIDSNLQSPRTVHSADLDGDTDMDVLSAALTNDDRQLVWYENTTIAGVADNSLRYLKVYPNPVKEVLHVATGTSTIQKIQIYDTLGRLLLEQKTSAQSIHIAQLPRGLLFVEVTTHDGVGTEKVMKL